MSKGLKSLAFFDNISFISDLSKSIFRNQNFTSSKVCSDIDLTKHLLVS